MDTLGYDAVDIGTLAESCRSEPDRPVYCQPYLPGQPPEGADPEGAFRRFWETPGIAVPVDEVKQLTDGAVRGPAGGQLPEDMASAAAGFDAK